MSLADAHVHLFRSGYMGRYGRASSGGNDLDVYRSLRLEHHVDTTLVVGYEGVPRYKNNNAYIAGLSRSNNWVAPVAFARPHGGMVPSPPFLGIALYLTTTDDANQFSRWPQLLVDQLAARRAIVSINAVPETLTRTGDAIRRLVGCNVLISHLGLPGSFAMAPSKADVASILRPLLSLSSMSHVGVKLSGFYALTSPMHAFPHLPARAFIDPIVSAYGTARLYWGSDFSPALDYVSFAQTVHAVSDLPWSDSERTAVMGGNLRRLVGATRRVQRASANR